MKTIKKVSRIFLFGLVILLVSLIFISINNQKKELPDGTLMSMNRFTKEISVKLDSNNYYVVDKSGNVSYKDGNKKEIFFIDSKGNDSLYKTLLSVFKDY